MPINRNWTLAFLVIICLGSARPAAAQLLFQQQFVPSSQLFWDNSKNWTTNFGPAYRDTIESPTQFVACQSSFALCFHSGAEPLTCTMSPDGRSADCQCGVADSLNYTMINAILNYPVYQLTIQKCGKNGEACADLDEAPVCKFLERGALIPGADVISTFAPDTRDTFLAAAEGQLPYKECPKAPYAACMTAPCKLNPDGATASCKCPVFDGQFQLLGDNADCSLGGNLVPSASYIPLVDNSLID